MQLRVVVDEAFATCATGVVTWAVDDGAPLNHADQEDELRRMLGLPDLGPCFPGSVHAATDLALVEVVTRSGETVFNTLPWEYVPVQAQWGAERQLFAAASLDGVEDRWSRALRRVAQMDASPSDRQVNLGDKGTLLDLPRPSRASSEDSDSELVLVGDSSDDESQSAMKQDSLGATSSREVSVSSAGDTKTDEAAPLNDDTRNDNDSSSRGSGPRATHSSVKVQKGSTLVEVASKLMRSNSADTSTSATDSRDTHSRGSVSVQSGAGRGGAGTSPRSKQGTQQRHRSHQRTAPNSKEKSGAAGRRNTAAQDDDTSQSGTDVKRTNSESLVAVATRQLHGKAVKVKGQAEASAPTSTSGTNERSTSMSPSGERQASSPAPASPASSQHSDALARLLQSSAAEDDLSTPVEKRDGPSSPDTPTTTRSDDGIMRGQKTPEPTSPSRLSASGKPGSSHPQRSLVAAASRLLKNGGDALSPTDRGPLVRKVAVDAADMFYPSLPGSDDEHSGGTPGKRDDACERSGRDSLASTADTCVRDPASTPLLHSIEVSPTDVVRLCPRTNLPLTAAPASLARQFAGDDYIFVCAVAWCCGARQRKDRVLLLRREHLTLASMAGRESVRIPVAEIDGVQEHRPAGRSADAAAELVVAVRAAGAGACPPGGLRLRFQKVAGRADCSSAKSRVFVDGFRSALDAVAAAHRLPPIPWTSADASTTPQAASRSEGNLETAPAPLGRRASQIYGFFKKVRQPSETALLPPPSPLKGKPDAEWEVTPLSDDDPQKGPRGWAADVPEPPRRRQASLNSPLFTTSPSTPASSVRGFHAPDARDAACQTESPLPCGPPAPRGSDAAVQCALSAAEVRAARLELAETLHEFTGLEMHYEDALATIARLREAASGAEPVPEGGESQRRPGAAAAAEPPREAPRPAREPDHHRTQPSAEPPDFPEDAPASSVETESACVSVADELEAMRREQAALLDVLQRRDAAMSDYRAALEHKDRIIACLVEEVEMHQQRFEQHSSSADGRRPVHAARLPTGGKDWVLNL
ncbi:hypothetical protein DIPPA_13135 [Diplonema papillatum]|nr:hypothetical protein DIPPA_13135 [Diplonema papillatum]